ncbi:MAG: GntR family transcriptional regulator [Geminicoccaceae bacterium]
MTTKAWWEDAPQTGEPAGRNESEPLSARIAEAIRAMILTGDLKPGQRVPERLLTEQFAVSRTPLREAFRTLASEGLLELLPNRGAVVVVHSRKVLLESIEMIEILESAAGALAAERADDERIRHIAALTFEMKSAFLREDHLDYYRINNRIHRAIVEAAGNSVLAREHALINARLYRLRFAPNREIVGRWQIAMSEHEAILEALQARDGVRLSRLLREHLSHAWRRTGFDVERAATIEARLAEDTP